MGEDHPAPLLGRKPSAHPMKTSGSLLDAASLRKFTTLIPGRNLAHVGVDYLCVVILHAGAIAVFENGRDWGWPIWSLFPVALGTILLTGCIIHRIALLGHESSHYLLMRNRKWNEIAADLFCFFPLWGSLVNYRRKHTGHHLYPNQPGKDPNLGTAAAEQLFASFPMSRPSAIYKYYALFLWPPFVLRNLIQMGKVLGMGTPGARDRGEEPVRDVSLGLRLGPGPVGLLYLLTLFVALTWVRLLGNSVLIVAVPLGVHALASGVWALLPKAWFERQQGTLGYSKKAAGFIRLSIYAAIMMTATWARVFLGLQLGFYYLLFWLVPLLYVFPYLMLLRELYQHANLGTGNLDNSRVIHADCFTRWALLAYGNDFHLIHHMYPNIPHYHLRAAHALLVERSEDYRSQFQEVHGTVHRRGPDQTTLAESWAAEVSGNGHIQLPGA
jgi:fatty acid desaturase